MLHQLKAFFTFPRRQRNGIVVLLVLIVLVVGVKISLPYWAPENPSQDAVQFTNEIATFEAQLQPINAHPDSFSINLNTATAEELQAIKGVGPALAATIVAHRNKIGAFQQPEELLEVTGIGPSTLKKIAPYIFIAGDTTRGK